MSVKFYHPYGGPTLGISLRNPTFGNTDKTNLQVDVKHSRNGDIYAYRRTPSYRSFKLDFENIVDANTNSFSTLDQVRAFLKQAAADFVLYIDKSGTQRKIIILTSEPELTCTGKNGCGDLYSMSLEVEEIE